MEITPMLSAKVHRALGCALPCLLVGSGGVLLTGPVFGAQFVLPESGLCLGSLALLVYSAHAQRQGQYPQALAGAMNATLCCLFTAGLAGIIAGYTLVAPRAVGWDCSAVVRACPLPDHVVLAGVVLACAAALLGAGAILAGWVVVTIWRLAPTGEAVASQITSARWQDTGFPGAPAGRHAAQGANFSRTGRVPVWEGTGAAASRRRR
jgi:hypothetical protein